MAYNSFIAIIVEEMDEFQRVLQLIKFLFNQPKFATSLQLKLVCTFKSLTLPFLFEKAAI
jgi:hypothetical protein